MKRKQVIVLFLFLLSGLAIYLIASGENKDKIGTIVENQKGKVLEIIKKNGSVVLDKAGEKVSEVYEAVKEKGGEAVQSAIITPTQELAKSLVKKVLISATSILTPEDIEGILVKKEGKITCEYK
jgi:hypothetical protein